MPSEDIALTEATVLGINEHVRLRREETGVIIYWSVKLTGIDDIIDTSVTQYLPSSDAMMLALFDGKRSLKEIFKATKYIWDVPLLTFTDFCKKLEKFILLGIEPLQLTAPVLIEITENRKQKLMRYKPEDFIIKGNKFCPRELTLLKFPTALTIMPTMDCFTDCVYCYMGRAKYSSLPFARWKELFSEVEKYQLSDVTFGGGDPMCYEHILDMLEIISVFNPSVMMSLATKAYISPEVARRLASIIFNKGDFQISLDSTDPDIADAMVQRKGHGKRAMESIKNLIEAGLIPSVKSVVTSLNIQSMPQTILDLHNLGVYPIRVAIYVRSIWHHKDELFNNASKWKEFEKRVKEIEEKHDFKVQMQGGYPEESEPKKSSGKHWDKRSSCPIGKKQITILPDGNLLGCEQIPQIPEYFLGSVAKDSLYDVWHSEPFKKKAYDIPRKKYKGTACYDCKEFEECHSAYGKGYCVREAYRLFGTIYAPDPGCPYVKEKLPRQQ